MAEQLQAKVEQGSQTRAIVEERVGSFSDKAKDFVLNELNGTASALLRAIDDEDASLVLAFNQALEVCTPPIAVVLAGILSPTILQIQFANHLVQVLVLFLPAFVGTVWSLCTDYGAPCDIPGMRAWTCIACVISGMLVVSHCLLLSSLSGGLSAVRAKSIEVQERLIENAADGETDLSDMQEIVVGGTVLVQEALLVEDGIRRSRLNDVIGVCSALWIPMIVWNFVIVIGWTFVPGQISFFVVGAEEEVPEGAYCAQWASAFVARMICLLTPLVFFLNIAHVVYWAIAKALGSAAFERVVLSAAKAIDDGQAGIPVATTLVKAVLLRAAPDADRARLAVALGEAMRLTKMRQGLESKLGEVQQRINSGKLDRKALKTLVQRHGDSMQEQLVRLEKAGAEDTAAWKEKGAELVQAAEERAATAKNVVTAELDKVVQQITELSLQVKDSQMVQDAMEKAQKAAEEARAAAAVAAAQAQQAAAEGLAQAQEAATQGLAQAQIGIEAGIAYAQSDEVRATLAQAQAQAQDMAAQAQSGLESGIAYAQSDEARAAFAQVQAQAQGLAAQAQSGLESGIAYAQSDEARAALAQAQAQAQGLAGQAQAQASASLAQAQSGIEAGRSAAVGAAAQAQQAAAEGLAQAQSAAAEGLAQAQSGLESGIAYAQSDDARAAIAQAAAEAKKKATDLASSGAGR